MAEILWALAALLGALVAALGLLWSLQGANLVHIEPVACVADCEPLSGFSATWLVTGIVTLAVGLAIAWQSIRRLRRRVHPPGSQS